MAEVVRGVTLGAGVGAFFSGSGATTGAAAATGGGVAIDGVALAEARGSSEPRSAKNAPPAITATVATASSTQGSAEFFGTGLEVERPRCAVVEASGNDAACTACCGAGA